MRARRRRVSAVAGFALLALVAELGRAGADRRRRPRAPRLAAHDAGTPYYPFLLVGVKVLVGARARACSSGGSSARTRPPPPASGCSSRSGSGRLAALPRPRLSLSPRLWLASFAATSLWYLVQSDAGAVSAGRWPLLAPWLHTYALPVFAVLSVLVAIGWGAVRDWLADVEDYAAATFARAFRHPAHAGPLPARRNAADRRARAAPPLRARLRVAPASAPRLTPATLAPPRVAVVHST